MPLRETLLLATLLVLIPLLVACFMAFDRLVRLEYSSHRSRWELDGRPRGFFWWPSEAGELQSYLAQQRLSFRWLFSTPIWMLKDPAALRLLWWFRGLVLAWHLAIVCAATVIYLWVLPKMR